MKFFEIRNINQWAAEPRYFVTKGDRYYDDSIFRCAEKVLQTADERPIVLLSGPSGSGKTTSALRIEALLNQWGHKTHTLSMDNYFYRRDDGWVPRDEEGKVDYESPYMMDIDLFQQHLRAIRDCKPVEVPSFDFINQRRRDTTTTLHRQPGEVVVVEGIHALNPLVTGGAQDYSTGIYVSVRSRVKDDKGNILHPKYIRLLRRFLRDRVGRGQSLENTLERLDSVERGEEKFIMPHKNNAEIHLDTFCLYELCLYTVLLPELRAMAPEHRNDPGIRAIIDVLEQVTPISSELVPHHALVREFVGGGLAGH